MSERHHDHRPRNFNHPNTFRAFIAIDIEPEARYITAEFMDSEEEAVAWAKRSLGDTVEILEVEDVTDTRRI